MTKRDLEIVQMLIAQALERNPAPVARDAVVVAGTHNPKDGTADALFGDTYAIIGDDGDQFISYPKIPSVTTQLGDQYGPVGNERAVLIPTQSGYVKLFIHGPDDSPGAPAGERWITHRNASATVDSYSKFTNDGPTPSDGLGGLHHNGGALHQSTTSGGHSIALNDTAKTVTVTSASGHTVTLDDSSHKVTVQTKNGLSHVLDDSAQKITHTAGTVKTIIDGAGNTISHVATQIGLGDLPGNLPSSAAAITNSHLTTFESSLLSKRLDDLTKFAAAMVSAGVPSAGAVMGLLASLVHVPVPSGSATTLIK